MNAGIIGNIVPEIGHRRRKDRGDPDGVDAKLFQVIEPADDAFQVADPIAVAILKRSWIDLINNSFLPPQVIFGLLLHAYFGLRR